MELTFAGLRRPILLGLGAMATVALSACHSRDDAAAPSPMSGTPASTSASAPTSTPSISQGRLVLSAVTGNPAAAYFTLTNGPAATTIASVAIDGADKAEMHETVGSEMKPLANLPVAAGAKVIFAPGGKHVMVFGVKPSVTAGSTAKITVTFTGGTSLSALLKVEAAGGSDNSMPGMKM